jgi:cyclopropane fatty-acyl-phospholipid synthase-like methyltransferase
MDFFSIFFIFYLTIILVAVPVVFCIAIWGYLYPLLFWGAIYVPTSEEKIEKMVKLLKIKPGQKVVDLGAGDGRVLVALAKAGAKAYGYEINPYLVSRAIKNIQKAKLADKAFIYWKSMWTIDLKDFDAVAIYPMEHIMKRLEKKFEKELKPGAKIVSNYFLLPTWKPDSTDGDVRLYVKK